MNTLVKHLLILLLPIAGIVGFFEYNLSQIPNSYSVKNLILKQAGPTTETLFLGTSHILSGVNPTFLKHPALNLANNGQPLYYDKEILRRAIAAMPNLKTAVISVSYFSLGYDLPETPEYWRQFFYERFQGIPLETSDHWLDIRRFSLLALYGQRQSMIYASKGFAVTLAGAINTSGYSPLHGTVPPGQWPLFPSHEEGRLTDQELINRNISYITEMLDMARAAGVQAIIITPPHSAYYTARLQQDYYGAMQSELEKLSADYGVQYTNYLSDARFGDEDFSDQTHLNDSGAKKFSQILDEEFGL